MAALADWWECFNPLNAPPILTRDWITLLMLSRTIVAEAETVTKNLSIEAR